jgi:hypothetical protein
MTTPAPQLAVEAVVDLVSAIGGIMQAPDYPPEQLSVYPFLVCYLGHGEYIQQPIGVMTGLHSIIVQLHVGRSELPLDVQMAMGYISSIPHTLFDNPTLNGTCSTFGAITYDAGFVEWANVTTFAITFTIQDVKIQEIL